MIIYKGLMSSVFLLGFWSLSNPVLLLALLSCVCLIISSLCWFLMVLVLFNVLTELLKIDPGSCPRGQSLPVVFLSLSLLHPPFMTVKLLCLYFICCCIPSSLWNLCTADPFCHWSSAQRPSESMVP